MTLAAHPPVPLADLLESRKEELIQRWARQVRERLQLGASSRSEVRMAPLERHEWDALVQLAVYNEGPPITSELLPTLFEPYRRGPESGKGRGSLGLGLFITRQIVLGHGGAIGVRSTLAEGTPFTLRLPRRPSTPSS